MTDQRASKRKSDAEPKVSTTKKARGGSDTSGAESVAESHDDATQTTNLDANGAEIHWEWENEEEVITKTTITEERIIALRSKIISTPIQRSVLAVSHVYTHGRPLQDGDIGRLVNADEDEVLEVHSDEDSEISTPRRRLYQRTSTTSGARSSKRDSTSARRSSRANGADDETTSEHHSSTSRSSRRSTSAAVGITTTSALASSSRRSTSSAATTAALTLTMPISATPSGRGGRRASRATAAEQDSAPSTPRSTRSSRQSSPAHSPTHSVSSIATGRGSTASTAKRAAATRGRGKGAAAVVSAPAEAPLAPMVLAFNLQNQQANELHALQHDDNNDDNNYDNDYNNDYNEPNPVIHPEPDESARTTEEVSWFAHMVRVVKSTLLQCTKPLAVAAVVMFICFALVYLRNSAGQKPTTSATPQVTNTSQFNFTNAAAERHIPVEDPAIVMMQRKLDAQREQLVHANVIVENIRVTWQNTVQQAEAQASAEMKIVHNVTLDAINSLAENASLLDAHLGDLAKTAHGNIAQLEQNLTALHTLDEEQTAEFDAQLQQLTPTVANLTVKAQELDSLMNAGVQVLQEVIHSFPHFDPTTTTEPSAAGTDANSGVLSLENVVNLAKETKDQLTAASLEQEQTNTLLNEKAATLTEAVRAAEHELHNTEAAYQATHETHQQQVEEAIQDIAAKQEDSVLRAKESLVQAAAAATKATVEQRDRMHALARRAAQEQEAQRQRELEEAEANSVHPLSPVEAEQLVQSVAEPVLREELPIVFKQHQRQVDAAVDRVFNNEMVSQQEEIEKTLASPPVKQVVQNILQAKSTIASALNSNPSTNSATINTATTNPDHILGENDDLSLPHNYGYGPRGAKVVHPRRYIPLSPKNSADKRLTSPSYVPPTSNSGGSGWSSFASLVSNKHKGNTHYTDFPRVVQPQCVVSHLRPTVTDFYPLPMEIYASAKEKQYRSKSSASQSVPQITVEMHNRVQVHSIKLIHAAKNKSYEVESSNTISSDLHRNKSPDDSLGEVQACAPERVRFIGWTLDPLNSASVNVDLGTYRFDSFSVSNDYAISEKSDAHVSVYEQVFDIEGYLIQHNQVGTALKAVTLQVLSNYGEEKFTCVHRLQVIGVLETVE